MANEAPPPGGLYSPYVTSCDLDSDGQDECVLLCCGSQSSYVVTKLNIALTPNGADELANLLHKKAQELRDARKGVDGIK